MSETIKKKKIFVSISFLFLVLVLFIVVFQVQKKEKPQEIRIKAVPSTTLSFSPASLTKGLGETFTLNVIINTGENAVSAAEIHVSFDPDKLSCQNIIKGDFLPNVLLEGTINQGQGRASITLGSQPANPKKGSGNVAILTFKTLALTGASPAIVEFTSETQAAAVGERGTVLVDASSASISITQASLGFSIKFQGIHTQRPDRRVKVSLEQDGTLVETFENVNVAANNQGVYLGTISDVSPDTYDVLVKGPVHLQKKFENINLTAGTNTQDWSTIVLQTGDAIGNNKIDIYDYNKLVGDFGPRMPEEGSPADFDLDGDVDIFDYNFLVGNFGKSGD